MERYQSQFKKIEELDSSLTESVSSTVEGAIENLIVDVRRTLGGNPNREATFVGSYLGKIILSSIGDKFGAESMAVYEQIIKTLEARNIQFTRIQDPATYRG